MLITIAWYFMEVVCLVRIQYTNALNKITPYFKPFTLYQCFVKEKIDYKPPIIVYLALFGSS